MKLIVKLNICETDDEEHTGSAVNNFNYSKVVECDDYLSFINSLTSVILENSNESFRC